MTLLHRLFWSAYGSSVWDERPIERSAVLTQRIAEILRARQRRPGEDILDAGCGTGNHAIGLARAGFRVTGVDYAPGMLARAVEKRPPELADRITYREEDLDRALPFPDTSFDHAISISSLQVARDPSFTLSELARVLRPGGTLVVAHVPRPATHGLPLRAVFQERLGESKSLGFGQRLLVVAKALAERWRGTRYWSAAELQALLEAAGFIVLELSDSSPIFAVVEKAEARAHAA